jgi:hypothetical protein
MNSIALMILISYPNGNANRKVITGTMLTKAQANVAEVY